MTDNLTIGPIACPGCGAKCEGKQDKSNRIYTTCNGKMDAKMCGTRLTLGHEPSREFIAASVKAAEPDPAPKKPKTLKENPPKETETDDRSTGDGSDTAGAAGKFLRRKRA